MPGHHSIFGVVFFLRMFEGLTYTRFTCFNFTRSYIYDLTTNKITTKN